MSVLNTGSIPRVMLGLGEKKRNKAQFSASGSVFKELENYGQAWIGRWKFLVSQIPSPFANGDSEDLSEMEN